MRLEDKLAAYLEYCEYRKQLDKKTLKAYRIDLRQYFEHVNADEPDKEKIEEFVTYLHKSYKRLTAQGSYRWSRNKSEVRNLTWREFDWLMSGIDIEQPKAIKAT